MYRLLICFLLISTFANSQVIDGKTYTPFSNYYKWRGGAFDSSLLIPTLRATSGKRPGAIQYNAADSSVYSWTGTQWRKVSDGAAASTLQQVTTAGNRTSNTMIVTANNNFDSTYIDKGDLYLYKNGRKIEMIAGDAIYVYNDGLEYTSMGENSISFYDGTFSTTINRPLMGQSNTQTFPDTTGNLSVGVRANGVTYMAGPNGIANIGNVTTDTTSLSNRINLKLNISDTASMLNNYKFTAANGLTKDSTVFRLGGSLNQNTNINLNNRRLNIIAGVDTTRFFTNGSVNIGGSATDSSYKLYVRGGSKILNTLTVGATDRDTINDQFANIYSDKEILARDGFFVAGPNNAPRIKTGIDRTSNKLRLWSADAPIVTVDYVGGGTNASNLQILDDHNTASGLSGNVNTLRVSGGLNNIYGNNTSVHNQILIDPSIIDSFSISKFRGVYYNPTLIYTASPLTHIAFENSIGNNLLNSTSGNTRIGYSTNDSTYKLDVNGKAKISDTLTLSTTPVTSDTSANDLLVINSSNGQVRRYTGAWPSAPLSGSATLDFGNTSAQNSADLTITVTGAADGDVVSLGVPNGSVNANTCFTAWVSATDTVTVRFNNYSSGAVDPASGTFKIKVIK